jgi:hypothetical protein
MIKILLSENLIIMTLLSISEASKLTGKSIPTIYRHIKEGKLSKSNDKIDKSELLRVYGAFREDLSYQNSQNENQIESKMVMQNEFLARENQLLRQQIEREREQTDHWRMQATMLLNHQPDEQPKTKTKNSVLFKKIFGRNL